jgi:hypothetical protein
MTLLETAVATVLLAVAAVTCLESTREAVAASRRAAAWQQAVAQAEVALAVPTAAAGGTDPRVQVVRRRYAPGVALVEVTVRLPDGGVHRTARLVPEGAP